MEIDFITALGRLLRDGRLRAAFAADPRAVAVDIGLAPDEIPTWLQLTAADVEVQAGILLQKRLTAIRRFLPETLQRLGQDLSRLFLAYTQDNWPRDPQAFDDAWEFCRWLRLKDSASIARTEWNRLQFIRNKKTASLRMVRQSFKNRSRPALQILYRNRPGQWRELVLAFGF